MSGRTEGGAWATALDCLRATRHDRLSPQAPAIGLATLVVASLVVFAVLEVLPGDPARLMLGMNATPEALRRCASRWG